jgi:ISXO2-like transposase domain
MALSARIAAPSTKRRRCTAQRIAPASISATPAASSVRSRWARYTKGSKIPLNKWLAATHLLMASKKGVSALQVSRMLALPYKTAWFVMHRIRESLRETMPEAGPLGGKNKTVEADETYVGGKRKEPVLSLVERGSNVSSRHVPDISDRTLRDAMVTQIDRASYIMNDETPQYVKIGEEFAGLGSVSHSAEEYVRAYFWHTNTAEGYFSILKRG